LKNLIQLFFDKVDKQNLNSRKIEIKPNLPFPLKRGKPEDASLFVPWGRPDVASLFLHGRGRIQSFYSCRREV
jgi:hypothetical protein